MNRVQAMSAPEIAEVNVHAVAALPSDLAIMKLENENIMALAAARPRDHHKIKAELLTQIQAYPSFARDVIYCKPVGKDQQGRMQYARGLSIRAAEAIAEAYGFNRVRCDVSPIDDGAVKVEATFTDYQRGRIWQDSGIVSKFYRARTGHMVRHADDRFYAVVVKAEASRRIREVILRSVPPGLRSELMEMAEQKIEELLDDSTIQKIIAKFAGKGVDLPDLERHIGRTLKAGWTKDNRKDLLGLWNAIESGETNVQEAFAPGEGAGPASPGGNGPVTGQDLAGAMAAESESPQQPAVEPNPADLVATDFLREFRQRLDQAATQRDFEEAGAQLMAAKQWLGDPRYGELLALYQERFRTWQGQQKRMAKPKASDI